MRFHESREYGSIAEQYVSLLLRNAGLPASRNKGKDLAGWDIKSEIKDTPFTIEVKFDLMASRTGNVAIEYHNSKQNRPSGIATTTADLWAYVFEPLSCFVCRADELKNFLSSVKPVRRIVAGGDNNASLALYPKTLILPTVFMPMDGLLPEETFELLESLLWTS